MTADTAADADMNQEEITTIYIDIHEAMYRKIRDPRVVTDRINQATAMGYPSAEDIAEDEGLAFTPENVEEIADACLDQVLDGAYERALTQVGSREYWNSFKDDLRERGWVFRGEYGIPPEEQQNASDVDADGNIVDARPEPSRDADPSLYWFNNDE